MSKMTAIRALSLLDKMCMTSLCKKCPIKDECAQFSRVHKCLPTTYIQRELRKDKL